MHSRYIKRSKARNVYVLCAVKPEVKTHPMATTYLVCGNNLFEVEDWHKIGQQFPLQTCECNKVRFS